MLVLMFAHFRFFSHHKRKLSLERAWQTRSPMLWLSFSSGLASLATFTSIASRLLLADRGPFLELDSRVESSSSALAESDSEEN
jgi:hypothetical protein